LFVWWKRRDKKGLVAQSAMTIFPVDRLSRMHEEEIAMQDTVTTPRLLPELKVERPKLHKVILVNDDFTPREFVTRVLKAEFRLGEARARNVMMTAHQRGVCVVSVFTKDIAEEKATNATDAGRKNGYPLLFTTEPEE
jgi:ATP-dependent Clp protease adaptor protein ClpS